MIQLLVIISLALSLMATMPDGGQSPLPALWQVEVSPVVRATLTVLTVAAIALISMGVNLLAAARLDRDQQLDRSRYRRIMNIVGYAAAGAFLALLLVVGWQRVVLEALGLADWPVLAELAVWSPFGAMLIAMWMSAYPVDRRIRQIDMANRLQLGLPVYAPGGERAIWSLWQFLAFQLRFHLLLVLLPLIVLLALSHLMRIGATALAGPMTGWGIAPAHQDLLLAAATLGGVLAVFIVVPAMLVIVLSTRPLPDGELRDKLQTVLERARVTVRRILLWRTHGMISNAAVMGVWGRLRYVLLSDGLIETLTDEQIEGVFGHELGHVIHRHIIYYLLFVFGAMLWVAAGLSAVDRAGWLGGHDAITEQVAAAAFGVGAVLFALGALVFCWVSRRFEWQADLAGAQMITIGGAGESRLMPVDKRPPGTPNDMQSPPSPAAAEIYAGTLYRIATINSLPARQRAWRHGSIQTRCDHVRRLADPARFERFNFTVAVVKLAILLLVAGGLAAVSLMPA